MEIDYTNTELNQLEIIKDDLILKIFETKDKRYCITQALKRAFIMGTKHKKFPDAHKEVIKE